MLAAPMTELEAVNDMLIGIGQLPVNAIIPEIVDQSIALGELNKVVREVCLYGFKFNTDEDHVLTPDVDGFIAVPTGALDIDPMDKAQDIIVRKHPTKGFGLWDAANLTWTMALRIKTSSPRLHEFSLPSFPLRLWPRLLRGQFGLEWEVQGVGPRRPVRRVSISPWAGTASPTPSPAANAPARLHADARSRSRR